MEMAKAGTLSNQTLSNLIAHIYDCVLDPKLWDATLSLLSSTLECPNAQLFLMDVQHNRVLLQKSVGVSPYWIERQKDYMPEINEHVERWLDDGLSMEEPLVLSRLGSPELLAASPYYQEYVRPQKYIDIAQVHLLRSPARLSGLGFGRHENVGIFRDPDIELLRLLVPHVRRAVTITNVLGAQAIETSRLREALDVLRLGIVLTGEDCRIVHANRAAEEMLQKGVPLSDSRGILRAKEAKVTAQIKAAVQMAARNEAQIGQSGLAVRLNGDDDNPIVVHVLPLAGSEIRSRLDPAAIAAVVVCPAVDDVTSARGVASSFGLTPAETKTLTFILAGKTVPETAEELGVAATTARTHLDSIFSKTGVSRQSQLIRLANRVASAAL